VFVFDSWPRNEGEFYTTGAGWLHANEEKIEILFFAISFAAAAIPTATQNFVLMAGSRT
jgi:hypothetical protein